MVPSSTDTSEWHSPALHDADDDLVRAAGSRDLDVVADLELARPRPDPSSSSAGLGRTWPGRPASVCSSPSSTIGTPLTMVACTPWGFDVQRAAPLGKSWARTFWSGPTVSGSKIMTSAA